MENTELQKAMETPMEEVKDTRAGVCYCTTKAHQGQDSMGVCHCDHEAEQKVSSTTGKPENP